METKGAPAFNLADLRAGAKKLHSVEESSGDKKAQGKTVADEGEEAVLKGGSAPYPLLSLKSITPLLLVAPHYYSLHRPLQQVWW